MAFTVALLKLKLSVDVKQIIQCVGHPLRCSINRCHCAFEAKDDFVDNLDLSGILGLFFSIICFEPPRTAHDCSAMLYVIASVKECDKMIISFSNSGIRGRQIRTLADVLSSKDGKLQVNSLNLDGNKLNGESVCYLFNIASSAFQSLTELYLIGNRISGSHVKSIVRALTKSCSKGCVLERLHLSYNPLEVSVLQAIQDAVADNLFSELMRVYLKGSLTSDACTNAVFIEALSAHCPKLADLDLSENNLGASGASALAQAVSRIQLRSRSETDGYVQCLSHIRLRETNLGDEGLTAFCDNLEGVCNTGGCMQYWS